jgi:hypothetical protein
MSITTQTMTFHGPTESFERLKGSLALLFGNHNFAQWTNGGEGEDSRP